MYRIIDNRDKELCEEAERQLQLQKQRFGKRYCPCSIVRTDDTICICTEFRNQSYEGVCHCGRFEKIKI